jgi:hypothetical protein
MRNLLSAAAYLSVAACGILIVMLMIALQAGVTQQKFEHVFALADYTAALSAARTPMFATLAFDNLFILTYAGAIGLGMAALRTPANTWVAATAAAGIVAAGLLDYAENLHFVTMYADLDAGIALSTAELSSRMWASLMKWHIVHAALFASSFVIPVRGLVSFLLVWSLRVALPVIGVLVYVGPEELRAPLALARYGAMLIGFVMFAVVLSAEAGRAPAAS